MKTAVVFHVPSREAFVLLKVGLDSFLEDAISHRPTCGLAQPAQDRVGGGQSRRAMVWDRSGPGSTLANYCG